jgi:hypothetical protein
MCSSQNHQQEPVSLQFESADLDHDFKVAKCDFSEQVVVHYFDLKGLFSGTQLSIWARHHREPVPCLPYMCSTPQALQSFTDHLSWPSFQRLATPSVCLLATSLHLIDSALAHEVSKQELPTL